MGDPTRIKNALTEIGCEKHFQKFEEQEIDWEEFLELDKDYLCNFLKIPLGKHRSWFSFVSPLFLILRHGRFCF
jgi:hypothetical protein